MQLVAIQGVECAHDCSFETAEQRLRAAGRPLRLVFAPLLPPDAAGRGSGGGGGDDGTWQAVAAAWQEPGHAVAAAADELAIQHVWSAGCGEWVKSLVWVRLARAAFRAGPHSRCRRCPSAAYRPSAEAIRAIYSTTIQRLLHRLLKRRHRYQARCGSATSCCWPSLRCRQRCRRRHRQMGDQRRSRR